jgi:hypothetical protein
MTKRSKKAEKSQHKLSGYAAVAVVEDIEQASEYKSLLEANEIPAVINQQSEQTVASSEIAVMVPEEYLDEAHVIIESQQSYDDLYDYAFDDENDEFGEALDEEDEF